jgi:heterodisulfide reductase subunit A
MLEDHSRQDHKPAQGESQEPRIGAYVCYCGGNISQVIECERVAKALSRMPDVVISRTDMSLCSDAGQSMIEKDIKELGINRVVIGACSPSLHEQTFRNTITRAGLNSYLYHHIGLREQASWVHHNDSYGATYKAIHLMSAGLAKARLLGPLDPIHLSAEQHALVIGGGVAGLRAALDIARQGQRVTLVEKSPFLGGRMAQLEGIFPTCEEARSLLHRLIEKVTAHPNITVLTLAELASVSGYVGNFSVQVRQLSRGISDGDAKELMEACEVETSDEFNYGLTQRKVIYRAYPGCYPHMPAVDWENYPGEPILINGKPVVLQDEPRAIELKVGAIVVATGFNPYEPFSGEYGYKDINNVVTLPQFIRHLALIEEGQPLLWNGHPVRDVAIIHCVGSRQVEGVDQPQADGQVNDYCSRVCCTAALHMAVELKERFPSLNVYDLHQDIRTYGRGHEDYYRRALDKQVRFVRFTGENRPVVVAAPANDTHPVLVRTCDTLTYGEEIELAVDLVVLAVGMMPRDIDKLVKMLKITRGHDRFLMEVHPKLRPVETAVNGIFLAGTAQSPMNIQETLTAASAAAAKVAALLASGQVELPPFVAQIDPEKCDGTGACLEVCAYEDAITLLTFSENGKQIKRATVNPANCAGCGVCVSACPNRAIDVQGWTLGQYESMVEALSVEMIDYLEAAG